jgi:hypothetical protein
MSDSDFIRARTSALSSKGSIVKLTAQNDAINAFEGLAKANGQRILDLLDTVDNTGLPFIEGLTRAAKRSGGNVDAAELKSVLTAFQTETSRILSNPNMTGVVSDSARHEVQNMAPDNMSVAQAQRVIKRIFTEMDLRKNFLESTLSGAIDRTVVGGSPNGPVPKPNSQPTVSNW